MNALDDMCLAFVAWSPFVIVDCRTSQAGPLTGDVGEETILDAMENAAGRAAFVIVDLEGAANLLGSYAISLADFVVIPVQASQLDVKQAARQMKQISS